jgi:NADPH-dependent 2,4-dienoyl-CoA reductase/sulfur reductase-like enzyme
MTRQVVVIGGDAAGASAASAVKRALKRDVKVTILERQRYTSYSACGIPYWMAGQVDGPDRLVVRSPEEHRSRGLVVRTRVEATAIDTDRQIVTARDLTSGEEEVLDYDDLVIATGATPVRPPIAGIDLPGVHGIQLLSDGLDTLESLRSNPTHAVVVGAGYIGIEMAEALQQRGLDVTIVDMAEQPMRSLDPDMGELIASEMEGMGITYRGGEPVQAIEAASDGRVASVLTESASIPADIVVLGLGVQPNSKLAKQAGLPTGQFGGILTDDHQRVEGYRNIWSGGDCVEVVGKLTGRRMHVALGTHANKHGRVIGANIAGGDLVFPGVLRTAVSKVCDLEISRVGMRQSEAEEMGWAVVSAVVKAHTRAHYFPGSGKIRVKVIAEKGTGRMLGCQIVGMAGSAKRIDIAATAIWNGMSVEDVASLDLGYSPPFSPVWDPVQTAARKAAGMV